MTWKKDRGQTVNVAADHPEVVESMLAAYDTFWKEARPLMVNESFPMSKTRSYLVDFRRQEEEQGIPEWSPRLP